MSHFILLFDPEAFHLVTIYYTNLLHEHQSKTLFLYKHVLNDYNLFGNCCDQSYAGDFSKDNDHFSCYHILRGHIVQGLMKNTTLQSEVVKIMLVMSFSFYFPSNSITAIISCADTKYGLSREKMSSMARGFFINGTISRSLDFF